MNNLIKYFKSLINQTENFGRKASLNIPYKSGTKEYQREYDRLMREKKLKERSSEQEESKQPKEPKVEESKQPKEPKVEESPKPKEPKVEESPKPKEPKVEESKAEESGIAKYIESTARKEKDEELSKLNIPLDKEKQRYFDQKIFMSIRKISEAKDAISYYYFEEDRKLKENSNFNDPSYQKKLRDASSTITKWSTGGMEDVREKDLPYYEKMKDLCDSFENKETLFLCRNIDGFGIFGSSYRNDKDTIKTIQDYFSESLTRNKEFTSWTFDQYNPYKTTTTPLAYYKKQIEKTHDDKMEVKSIDGSDFKKYLKNYFTCALEFNNDEAISKRFEERWKYREKLKKDQKMTDLDADYLANEELAKIEERDWRKIMEEKGLKDEDFLEGNPRSLAGIQAVRFELEVEKGSKGVGAYLDQKGDYPNQFEFVLNDDIKFDSAQISYAVHKKSHNLRPRLYIRLKTKK